MKKVIVTISVLIMFLFLVGCLDYKAYDLPAEEGAGDVSLIDEIALIEEEISVGNEEMILEEVMAEIESLDEDVVEEEVILPNLEETQEIVEEVLTELEGTPIELEEVDNEQRTINVKENELLKLNVNVADPDEDPVTFSFTKPINEKGEWQTSYGDAGEYIVTLSATDGKLTTTEKVKIVVERVNVHPLIEKVNDMTVDEGDVIEFEPEVTDPNNDAVTVTVSEPLKSGVFTTDHTSSGDYQIKVKASDGELETEETFLLRINDINIPPEISNVADLTLSEGEVVEINPEVTDLDGDPLTITISDPVGDDGLWETSYTDHGKFSVVIVADDGKTKTSQKINVVIEDVNMPPQIISIDKI